MSQQNESAAEQNVELTPEQVIEAIVKLREDTIAAAVESNLNFNAVFTALSQVVTEFVFNFLLITEGELTEESLKGAIAKFYANTNDGALNEFKKMREKIEAVKPLIILP